VATHLWDYLHCPGRNEMQAWAQQEKLGVRERAQLNQKLDMLERIGFDTAYHLSFLKGTSGEYNQIFKLVVKSERMLRPMLCRGPLKNDTEVTLLCGAIEKDFDLTPSNVAEKADGYRRNLLAEGGSTRRVNHDRF
jgi:hypothetical protein